MNSTERARALLVASKLLVDRAKPKTEMERELLLLVGSLFGVIEDLLKERDRK